jgi:hypothetical protein
MTPQVTNRREKLLGGGECPGKGWWWRELKESKKPSRPRIYKNNTKNRWFCAFIDLKIAENAVFYLKILNKIYFQDFEEYMNFKFFLLKAMWSLEVSYGPQPSGLGISIEITTKIKM